MKKMTIMCTLFKHAVMVLSIMVLAGCATLGSSGAGYSPRPDLLNPSGAVVSLLYYFDYIRNLPPAEFAKETEHARRLYVNEKSDFRLLQYALVLAVPGADARHAQQLIEPMVRETKENSGHERELRALAVLIYADLAERRRLDANAQSQTRRAEDMESKLDALKDIERKMMQRESPARDKP